LHSEKGLPTGASLFFAALPGIYSGRRSSRGGNPGLRRFHGERNSEIPAVLSLFPAVFAKKIHWGRAGAMSAGNAIFIMACEIHILLT
jgi:hypothetical protein